MHRRRGKACRFCLCARSVARRIKSMEFCPLFSPPNVNVYVAFRVLKPGESSKQSRLKLLGSRLMLSVSISCSRLIAVRRNEDFESFGPLPIGNSQEGVSSREALTHAESRRRGCQERRDAILAEV